MHVEFTANARRRLTALRDYYNRFGSQGKGTTIARGMIAQAKRLARHPELGFVDARVSTRAREHRCLIVDCTYKVMYVVEPERVLSSAGWLTVLQAKTKEPKKTSHSGSTN